jgi:tripartite-type tricarboxylate transporter receptor subunit TctC
MHGFVRGLALAAALAAATAVHAEDASYPSRPVRIIVPFAAGGPPDVISRIVAQKLSERWRQQVYVESLASECI